MKDDRFDAGGRVKALRWFDWIAGMRGRRSGERVIEDGEAPYYEHGDGWNEDVPDLGDRATVALLMDLATASEGEPDRFLFTTGDDQVPIGYQVEGTGSVPSTWLDRLRAERDDLAGKIDRLGAFVQGGAWPNLDEEDRDDLLTQLCQMRAYLATLDRRIGRRASAAEERARRRP